MYQRLSLARREAIQLRRKAHRLMAKYKPHRWHAPCSVVERGAKGGHEKQMMRLNKIMGSEFDDSHDVADLSETMLFAAARSLGFKTTDEMTVEAQEQIMTAAAALAQGMMHYLTLQVGIARVREIIETPGRRDKELGN